MRAFLVTVFALSPWVAACGGMITDSSAVGDAGPGKHHDGGANQSDGGATGDGSATIGDDGFTASGDMTAIGPSCVPGPIEICTNDVDDDCNGIVNDGCADTLGIGTTTTVAPYVGADGNAGASDLSVRCPPNAFVTSMSILFYDAQQQVSGVRLGCSTATLNRSSSGYSVSLVAVSPSPYASLIAAPPANGTGAPIVVTCPGAGLRGLFATKGTYDAGGILGYFGKCGAATLTLAADNTLGITIAAATTTATPAGSIDAAGYGGYDYGAGAGIAHTDVSWTCDAGSVLVGLHGRVSTSGQITSGVPGAALDKVQPICGTLTPHYIH